MAEDKSILHPCGNETNRGRPLVGDECPRRDRRGTDQGLVPCWMREAVWRYAPMGGAVGLSYPAVEAVIRMRRVSDQAGTFLRVRTIEMGALKA